MLMLIGNDESVIWYRIFLEENDSVKIVYFIKREVVFQYFEQKSFLNQIAKSSTKTRYLPREK